MSETLLQIDLPALLIATMAAIICSLCGAFLLLRRQALMSDALSHVVLPGIVVGYLASGTLAALPMLLGALGACLLAVALMAVIRQVRIIEPGAIMGIVFTALFAFGVLLLEQKIGGRVHLDAHHALYGALELTYWPGIFTKGAWQSMPADMPLLFGVMIAVVALVALFYKELKLSTFDPLLAQGQGLRPSWIGGGLLALSAIGCVAAFQAVGSILVIALFICPAACARLLTSSLSGYLFCSAASAIAMAVIGYGLAATAPLWLGVPAALSAAGMIAVTGGLMVVMATFCARTK
ncbi:MAG: metal ABC transporter permease [Micavibrio aeruginosavorus]|uniref:Metal ABC transporter permease n=1 Tax=Micavibrio aeruginosavorus TaxID=349221 RepID=A0A7T5R222_9BACT|nr:MAG: metal ABC transporter permease [Micavibrio aeruginosavorus]